MKNKQPKQRGFFMIANEIIHYIPQLGVAGFLVYCTLRRMTDRNDRCYPSLHRLTRMTGVEEEALKEVLDRLEALQLMQRLQQTNSLNDQPTDIYLLPLYPKGLETVDDNASKEWETKPGSQLILELSGHETTPIIPSTPDPSLIPKKVDDPPQTDAEDRFVALITLLVEQMQENTNQMNSLIQRMDRVIERTVKEPKFVTTDHNLS